MRKRNFIQFNLFPFSEEDADVEWQESWIEKQKGIIIKIKCMKMSNFGVCEAHGYPFVHFVATHIVDNNCHLKKMSHFSRKKNFIFCSVLDKIIMVEMNSFESLESLLFLRSSCLSWEIWKG